ncbi:hypothetical protein ZIOFF_056645 [Zingiber officinale]|uniref:Uncharacterized protein n=1 Tax=Zingiber officinale TaxID=94328 RepID=A0A8J5KFG2_ZINOF|nr:hypothetical protein ZIOFF_056645 [Zingiber officinale]
MCWEYVPQICSLYMSYLDGKVLLTMVVFFVMPLADQLVLKFLKLVTTWLMLVIAILLDFFRLIVGIDPQESIEDNEESEDKESDDEDDEVEYIRTIVSTDQWNAFRNNMAIEMILYDSTSCLTHKDAKGLYNVSFPYFTDLDIVYGKDRATGDVAEDPLAAEQNLENADVTLPMIDESDSNTEIEILSTMKSLPSNSSSARSAKKKFLQQVHKTSKKTKFAPMKNAEIEYKEFNDKVRGFMKSLDGHFGTISAWMQGTTSRMPQVLELLEKHGFSGPNKYKASKAICQDPLNVDLLFSLDSTETREYVLTLI